jgi:phosphoenolpyruvate carboxykinase (GTP)
MNPMNPYLEALLPKVSPEGYTKLAAIDNPNVHEFIAKASDLCHPDQIFVCSDSAEDIEHVRRQAIATCEEKAILTLRGHTVHFDGEYDQGRDRQNTKYLVHRITEQSLSKSTDKRSRRGKSHGDSMKGRTMIVRFISWTHELNIQSRLQCTDSWYVAHSEDLLYRSGTENSSKQAKNVSSAYTFGQEATSKVSIDHEKTDLHR